VSDVFAISNPCDIRDKNSGTHVVHSCIFVLQTGKRKRATLMISMMTKSELQKYLVWSPFEHLKADTFSCLSLHSDISIDEYTKEDDGGDDDQLDDGGFDYGDD